MADVDVLSIFTVSAIVIEATLHCFDSRRIFARHLMERNRLREWYWHLPMSQTIVTQLLRVCSAAMAAVDGIGVAIFPVVQLIIYGSVAVYCLHVSPKVLRSASVLLAAVGFSCAIDSLVALVCVIADFDTGPLLLIFVLLLIAATIVLLSVVGKLQVFNVLRDFEQCNADAADADSLMSEAWATPGAMKRAMHIGVEHRPHSC
jgi:hypothetical protein